ncbi:MAG: Asp-tRNA(Asn)/Glu-tRNA(Gln) amidotransferase subunit GatC [Paenibacillaceae bacterium]|jgi:aspartyl-tRNA(Asn)/glutamyl-tRNA(Gln) amidotransferase subunit C|nr:Asp-tRNA(Asn)/Glu-tRNA(Gln) amidotransferase subunit GatC [Paenibacillaceae bacterium]
MHEQTDVASHVAALALLHLDAQRHAALAQQLHEIVQYAHKLYEVDVAHVDPMSHGVVAAVPWRTDTCARDTTVEQLLHSAPAREGTFYVVPPVIE